MIIMLGVGIVIGILVVVTIVMYGESLPPTTPAVSAEDLAKADVLLHQTGRQRELAGLERHMEIAAEELRRKLRGSTFDDIERG